jgi:hypothetical protein
MGRTLPAAPPRARALWQMSKALGLAAMSVAFFYLYAANASLLLAQWDLPDSASSLKSWIPYPNHSPGSTPLVVAWTERDAENFYDLASAPQSILRVLQETIARGGDCDPADRRLLVTTCCHTSCGGFADRVRGLPMLLLVAKLARRPLCLSRDYFLAAPEPRCDPREGKFSFITWKDLRLLKAAALGSKPKQGEDASRFGDLLHRVRFVTSNFKLPQLAELGLHNSSDYLVDGRRLGVLALAYSRSINQEMITSGDAVVNIAALNVRTKKFVSLHVRCGGSSFTVGRGIRIDRTTDADDEFNFLYPELLLSAARATPRNIVCQKALYIASDSTRFRAELQLVLPKGVTSFACCSTSHHIDKQGGRNADSVQQHLIDIQAFALSEKIFATGGGFAITGAFAGSWDHSVPSLSLSRTAQVDEVKGFMQEILKVMNCSTIP